MPVAKPDAQQQEINQIQQLQMNGGNILSGPPPDRIKKPDTTMTKEQLEQKKQQDELNEIEQMKGSGNILSGPPPDRLPAKDTTQPKQKIYAPAKADTVPVNQTPVAPPVAQPVKQDTVPANQTPAPPKEGIKQESIPPTPPVQQPVKQDTVPVDQTRDCRKKR